MTTAHSPAKSALPGHWRGSWSLIVTPGRESRERASRELHGGNLWTAPLEVMDSLLTLTESRPGAYPPMEDATVEDRRLSGVDVTLGMLVATARIRLWMDHTGSVALVFVMRCVRRHQHGDWGDLDPADWAENNLSYGHGYRILSAYPLPESLINDHATDRRLWIITEADRSATTVLWPSDY